MNTTISISKKTRDILRDYGKKSENYDDIIKRMYNNQSMMDAVDRFLLDKGFMTLEEARELTRLQIMADENKNNRNKRPAKTD